MLRLKHTANILIVCWGSHASIAVVAMSKIIQYFSWRKRKYENNNIWSVRRNVKTNTVDSTKMANNSQNSTYLNGKFVHAPIDFGVFTVSHKPALSEVHCQPSHINATFATHYKQTTVQRNWHVLLHHVTGSDDPLRDSRGCFVFICHYLSSAGTATCLVVNKKRKSGHVYQYVHRPYKLSVDG